ncbi:MAG: hypothetical protein ACTHM9_15490 [Gemmatimonadales bacterium]
MPNIFVDTAHGPTNKLYDGSKAGAASGKAEAKMQAVVKDQIDHAAGFTTVKDANAKGYIVRLEISKVEIADHKTKCKMSGSITRYPKGVAMGGAGKGDEMVSLGWGGSAMADGTNESAMLDCVEAITEDMLKKTGINAMRTDFAKR